MLYLLAADAQAKSADETVFSALFLVSALFFIFLFSAWFIRWRVKFRRELRYVNQRIDQSLNERERLHYVRRRRRLWLSLIPFVKYKYH